MQSIKGERGYPFDSSSALLCCCAMSTTLYFLSLTLHVNIVGDYAKADGEEGSMALESGFDDDYFVGEDLSEKGKSSSLPSRCGIWGEVFNVPARDLAVLIEQATWR